MHPVLEWGAGMLCMVVLIIITVAYILLYLCSRGILDPSNERNPTGDQNRNPSYTASLRLLLYVQQLPGLALWSDVFSFVSRIPLGCILFLIPVIVTSLRLDASSPVLVVAVFAANGITGLCDVVIFFYARRGVLAVREVRTPSPNERLGTLPPVHPHYLEGDDFALHLFHPVQK